MLSSRRVRGAGGAAGWAATRVAKQNRVQNLMLGRRISRRMPLGSPRGARGSRSARRVSAVRASAFAPAHGHCGRHAFECEDRFVNQNKCRAKFCNHQVQAGRHGRASGLRSMPSGRSLKKSRIRSRSMSETNGLGRNCQPLLSTSMPVARPEISRILVSGLSWFN